MSRVITLTSLLVIVTGVVFGAPLSAQSFKGTKMYVERGNKLKLVGVALDVQRDALVAAIRGKSPKVVRLDYSEITRIEYEKTSHRRWKAGVLVSGLFLLSKAKKHWLVVTRGEEENVFQLSKKNYSRIISAIESKLGKKVKMVAPRD